MPNAECRTPNAEWRTPKPTRRTPGRKERADDEMGAAHVLGCGGSAWRSRVGEPGPGRAATVRAVGGPKHAAAHLGLRWRAGAGPLLAADADHPRERQAAGSRLDLRH